VPVGDADALRSAISELWEQPDKAAALGANGRQLVAQHRRLDQQIGELTSLLAKVAAEHRRGTAPGQPVVRAAETQA
jgi:glycosyltransferase involved in cell wall biosynthesis